MTMNLKLSVEQADKIVGFLGYGRPTAPVWFIGLEEGLGNMDEQDASRNLAERAKFDSVMDLYRAHLKLYEKGAPIDFNRKIPSTQVWKFMAKIMRAREGCQDWADKGKANLYIRTRLGRSDGDVFMTELSPIPASNKANKSWMEMFAKIEPQLASKIERRREALQGLLKTSKPALVICYGKTMEQDFAELLGVQWQPVNGRVSRAADPRCLLLPFLGNGAIGHGDIEDLLRGRLLRPDAFEECSAGGGWPSTFQPRRKGAIYVSEAANKRRRTAGRILLWTPVTFFAALLILSGTLLGSLGMDIHWTSTLSLYIAGTCIGLLVCMCVVAGVKLSKAA